MPNICTFWGKIVGDENEVREIVDYFEEPYRYQFTSYTKMEHIQKKLKPKESTSFVNLAIELDNIVEELIKTGKGNSIKTKEEMEYCVLNIIYRRFNQLRHIPDKHEEEYVKEFVENFKEYIDIPMLRKLTTIPDSLKKDFPKTKHFWRIFEVEVDDFGYYEDGRFYAEIFGDCAWSLNTCTLSTGYQDDWKEYEGQPWFKGTCLENVAKEFPELKMEFFSEEPGMELSEHITVKDGKVFEEVQELTCVYYESVEEAKEDDLEITKDQLNVQIYTKLPEWFYPEDDQTHFTFNYSI